MTKIGIICASEVELAPFLPHIDNCIVSDRAKLKFYEGNIGNVKIVVLFCGVCKVNASIATQILIDNYQVDAIVNSGTAGGMDERLMIFDTAVSTMVAYHDVQKEILTEYHPYLPTAYFPADSYLIDKTHKAVNKLNLPHNIFFGRMVTGEYFVSDYGRQTINERFAPLTVDMESCAIAHVCYANDIPFIAIRTVTDTAKHSGVSNFEQNCAEASAISKDITIALINELQ